MDLRAQLAFCKQCNNKKSDLKTGIYCSITGEKPAFEGKCENYSLVDKKEQKSTYVYKEEKSNTKAVIATIAVILIVIKIILRFITD